MKDNRFGKRTGGGRHGSASLYERVISKENLFAAWREFQQGKMGKSDVLVWSEHFESNLFLLHKDLVSDRYRHGQYTRFLIEDPKQRNIAKASVCDRVLHHAVHRIIEPLFERGFIFDSYSSRKGKGTHAGMERFRAFAWKLSRSNTCTVWFLKCDVRRFFDSIDHTILLRLIQRRITDPKLLDLLKNIVESFETQSGKGLPLGNLTSQLFANVYLDPLDQYIKRTLRVREYVRYADDFVLMSRNREELENALSKIRVFLLNKLALELHPQKVSFQKWHQGVDFLGFVHFPYFSVVRTKTKKRMMQKLGEQYKQRVHGALSVETFEHVKQSYLGVLVHGRGKRLRNYIHRMFPM